MRPLPPEIPDGSTASRDDMVVAGKAIRAFVNETERYLDCLKVQESLIPPNELSAQRQALMAQQHNAAVNGMEKVASQYNEAVRAFNDPDRDQPDQDARADASGTEAKPEDRTNATAQSGDQAGQNPLFGDPRSQTGNERAQDPTFELPNATDSTR